MTDNQITDRASRTQRRMTVEQVEEMRLLRAEDGWSYRQLSEMYGVSAKSVERRFRRGMTSDARVAAGRRSAAAACWWRRVAELVELAREQGRGLEDVLRAVRVEWER